MECKDIIYEKRGGIAKVIINRPEVHNAFRTVTLEEMAGALEDAAEDPSIGVIVLTGAGDKAFCSGGDMREAREGDGWGRGQEYWHTRVQQVIRGAPQPVIAAVNGWSIGGGHVLHLVCDLSIASEAARFGQVGPRVGSFDAGFGAAYLTRVVGEKKAREIWFLCRQYDAYEALEMGLVNKVVPPDKLNDEVESWCKEILALSPTSLKFLKAAFNAESDHIWGINALAMRAVRLYWGSDEAREARDAFAQKRKPNWSRFRR